MDRHMGWKESDVLMKSSILMKKHRCQKKPWMRACVHAGHHSGEAPERQGKPESASVLFAVQAR
eukprot:858741-Amphidinium_carterae.1